MQSSLASATASSSLTPLRRSLRAQSRVASHVGCARRVASRVVMAATMEPGENCDRRSAMGLAVSGISAVFAAPAFAALNNKKGADDAYAEMMAQMAKKKESGAAPATMSADSLYSESGGACGPGYELKVKKVLGASCECVDPAKCAEAPSDLSAFERSMGVRRAPRIERVQGE